MSGVDASNSGILSVIVPVYNTKEYLNKCVKSILGQTYRPIELLLVDDGSTDGSGELCDEYKTYDKSIKVIHQENKGLMAARMAGTKAAGGRYIMYVDSDDYIDTDLAESLMSGMLREKTDLVVSGLIFENENRLVRSDAYIQEGNYERKAIMERLVDNEISGGTGIPVSACGKVFLKDTVIRAFGRVRKRLSYGEDLAALLFYMKEIEKITVISKWGYHYVNRKGSMSNSVSIDYFREIKELHDYIESECGRNREDAEILRQANFFIRYLVIETLQGVFPDTDFGFISFLPPYELFPKGCRLAVYGAGRVGKSMVKCILQNSYATVTGWFDRDSGREIYGREILPPDKINEKEFDYILIAVSIKDYMLQIRERLEKMGIPDEKIVWKRPYSG